MCVATFVACAASTAVATAPPDEAEGSDVALAQFVSLGEARGYELTDPACAAEPDGETTATYTCYAVTASGEPFIARTSLGETDVVEFEILAEPAQTVGPAADGGATTTTEPTTTPAPFDALGYFAALFSDDTSRQASLQTVTAPGSPADAYLRYQMESTETLAEYDVTPLDPANVYLSPGGVIVCLTEDSCVDVTSLQVVDGQLVNFSVDANPIAPRLGRPGPVTPVGTATAQVRAAYRTVSTDALSVYVEITSESEAVFEFSAAVYVAADGHQTPIDPERSMVSTDVTMKGTYTVMLSFAGADPGGSVRFLVYPADGSAPLAAVLPITPL